MSAEDRKFLQRVRLEPKLWMTGTTINAAEERKLWTQVGAEFDLDGKFFVSVN